MIYENLVRDIFIRRGFKISYEEDLKNWSLNHSFRIGISIHKVDSCGVDFMDTGYSIWCRPVRREFAFEKFYNNIDEVELILKTN